MFCKECGKEIENILEKCPCCGNDLLDKQMQERTMQGNQSQINKDIVREDTNKRQILAAIKHIGIAAMAIIFITVGISGCASEDFKEAFEQGLEDVGGWEGVSNNVEEQVRDYTDALGITDREEYVIDENGALVVDENGNPVKRRVSDGTIITEEPSENEQATSSTEQRNGFNVYQIGDEVKFETEDGGAFSIILTDFGACQDGILDDTILYVDYTIENIGDISVYVGDVLFSIFADDYSVDQTYGKNHKGNTSLSSGRKVQGTFYGDIDPDTVLNLEVECANVVFVLKDESNSLGQIDLATYYFQEGENEDVRGAEVTIGYDDNGELRIVGESWNSIGDITINAVITKINDDGSMEFDCFDSDNEGILYVYPMTDGGIRIVQDGMIDGVMYEVTFDGDYQLLE